jgi:beta-lactamase superfamily II metal-dependent hydrolase
VVLTHAHDDHVNGPVEVLQRYKVEQVMYPEGIDYTSNTYSAWLSLIEEKGVDGVPFAEVVFSLRGRSHESARRL